MQFGQLRRREFLTISGSAAVAWPVAALSQEHKVRRIGALIFEIEDAQSFRTELREELRKLGYVEGRNILFEFRSAEEKIDRLPTLAAELVADKVDVIVALYTPCGLVAQRATREIPIVVVSGDPVETGLVESLNRPGGNITGVSQLAAECHGKCVELFRDMLPTARRIAALGDAVNPFSKPFLEQVLLAGKATSTEIAPVIMVRGKDEIDAAFATMKNQRADAVVVMGGLATKNTADLALEPTGTPIDIPRTRKQTALLPSPKCRI